jgi:UDP-N-acetylglucosamine acyltransferase
MTHQIHKSSEISSNVKLGSNVKIGPFCYISGEIEIADNTELISHTNIFGNVKIGSNNKIYPFSNIGCDPQDLKYEGEDSSLTIGDNNLIRENVTISKGTKGDKMITSIGNNNLFMTGTHVAHDCTLGNNNILANQATLAGHVKIFDNVIIGGISAVLQFITIGSYSMIGGMSGIDRNIMPGSLVMGNRAKLRGLNLVGLRRNNFSNEEIRNIEEILESHRRLLVSQGHSEEDSYNIIRGKMREIE